MPRTVANIPAVPMSAVMPRAEERPAEPAAAAPDAPQPIGQLTPLVVRAPEAARICGVSARTWERWRDGGLVPAPCMHRPRQTRDGRKVVGSATVLWSVEDLRRWVQLGMPDQRTFEARRGAGDGATSRGRGAR